MKKKWAWNLPLVEVEADTEDEAWDLVAERVDDIHHSSLLRYGTEGQDMTLLGTLTEVITPGKGLHPRVVYEKLLEAQKALGQFNLQVAQDRAEHGIVSSVKHLCSLMGKCDTAITSALAVADFTKAVEVVERQRELQAKVARGEEIPHPVKLQGGEYMRTCSSPKPSTIPQEE